MMLVLHYHRVPYIMAKADMKTRNKKTEVKLQVLPARETKQQESLELESQ